jgi:ribosome biogenesis GTPase
VLPRASRLIRPDPHDPRLERVLAANVELVLVVAALREPRLSVGLVERVVLATQRGGAVPLVVATKLDLCADAEALASLAPLRATGVDVVACSAKTGAGIDELRARVAGRLCALVGHSGVGKSSLLNALDPALALAEGRVRAADGKGRHTTTASSLHRLADGTRLIDTPGVREFGLWGMTRAELGAAFPDVAAAAERCRFRDCTHDHEPDCAVRAAATSGALSDARYRSYLRILATLDRA